VNNEFVEDRHRLSNIDVNAWRRHDLSRRCGDAGRGDAARLSGETCFETAVPRPSVRRSLARTNSSRPSSGAMWAGPVDTIRTVWSNAREGDGSVRVAPF